MSLLTQTGSELRGYGVFGKRNLNLKITCQNLTYFLGPNGYS